MDYKCTVCGQKANLLHSIHEGTGKDINPDGSKYSPKWFCQAHCQQTIFNELKEMTLHSQMRIKRARKIMEADAAKGPLIIASFIGGIILVLSMFFMGTDDRWGIFLSYLATGIPFGFLYVQHYLITHNIEPSLKDFSFVVLFTGPGLSFFAGGLIVLAIIVVDFILPGWCYILCPS